MSLVEFAKKDNHLAIVTLNNPERLNAFDMEMTAALREAWKEFGNDEDAWIAILTARGRAFSAGADKS